MQNSSHIRGAFRAGFGAACVLALWGCQTVSLPAVSPAMTASAQKNGSSAGSLESGRIVLTTRCIGCHGVQPLGKYSLEKWGEIVDKMAPRAKLTQAQERDLLAYISAARSEAQ